MKQDGLLVVDRSYWRTTMREAMGAEVPSVTADTIRRYRGFDGRIWPVAEHPTFLVEDGLAPREALVRVQRYVDGLGDQARDCELLLLDRGARSAKRAGWRCVGFDVGYIESEWSRFSCLFHEVIFGEHDALRAWNASLNGTLLMSSLADVGQFLEARRRLVAQGCDLEEGASFDPLAVFVEDVATRA